MPKSPGSWDTTIIACHKFLSTGKQQVLDTKTLQHTTRTVIDHHNHHTIHHLEIIFVNFTEERKATYSLSLTNSLSPNQQTLVTNTLSKSRLFVLHFIWGDHSPCHHDGIQHEYIFVNVTEGKADSISPNLSPYR
jgi:hypothetical protein